MGGFTIKSRVAFLGPEGTFTHEAACSISDNLIHYCSIQKVMDAVENGQCLNGVVPIENSIEGSVNLTLDSLVNNYNLMIKGEIIIPINHNLLAPKDVVIDDITNVYSHPQALAQCHNYLNKKGFKSYFTLSTAAAANSISKFNNSGAIGTLKAAELYDLNVVDKNIQDTTNNETRFVILSKIDSQKTGNDKTSIVFSLFNDKPGGLYDILGIFANNNINLTKIESRPSKEGLGNYFFFIDFFGHRIDANICNILKTIKEETSFMKILGSYPIFS